MSGSRRNIDHTLATASRVILLFGVLCYFTSCAMDVNTGINVNERLPAMGGEVGPFTLDEQTVLDVEVEQHIKRGSGTFKRWSFVTAELLDANKNYLTGFGGEMWHEAGYDEGYWRQSKTEYSNKITVPEAGTYYLRFKTESSTWSPKDLSPIEVEVRGTRGSSLPYHVTAILAFLIGGVMWWIAKI